MEVPGNPSPRRCGGRSGSSAGGVYQETSPSAQVQKAWLTSHFSVAARTFRDDTFDQPPDPVTVGTPVALSAHASRGWRCRSARTRRRCARWRVPPSQPWRSARAHHGLPARGALQAAPNVTRSFQVQAPAAPAITFDQPRDVTVGTPVALSANASSGLAVSFSSDTPSVCTVADSPSRPWRSARARSRPTKHGNPPGAPDVRRSFRVNPVPAGPARKRSRSGRCPTRRSARRSPCRRTRRRGWRCPSARTHRRCARWRVPPSEPWRPPVHGHGLAGRERPLRGGCRRNAVVPAEPGHLETGRCTGRLAGGRGRNPRGRGRRAGRTPTAAAPTCAADAQAEPTGRAAYRPTGPGKRPYHRNRRDAHGAHRTQPGN